MENLVSRGWDSNPQPAHYEGNKDKNRKTQAVTTTTGQSNNHDVKTLLSFKNNISPPTAPFTNQRGRLGGSTGYPSLKDEEGKGYDKRGVPLAGPLLSSFRKRITGTFGVMGWIGLEGRLRSLII